MLSRLVFDEPLPDPQPAVVTREQVTTWTGLRERAEYFLLTCQASAKRRVGMAFHPCADSYAALAALAKLDCDVFLLDARLSLNDSLSVCKRLKLGAVLLTSHDAETSPFEVHELSGEESWSGTSTITILTSGSTGEPKAARHSWHGIARPVRHNPGKAPRWLLTYRPHLYAGLQVMLQCFADRGTLVVPDSEMDPQSTAQFMRDNGVQCVSATPSYWRRLLMFASHDVLKQIPIAQITLGGEVVDQPVLDKLRYYYPNARLVHIYATTELGRCFSVGDGMAGFPVSYLNSELPDGVQLRVGDGELFVRSPNSMSMYDPMSAQQLRDWDWFATGDLVELTKDRVLFAGRKSDMINVAGSKVYPPEVERVIRVIPGVSDVRVFGKASSIAGELVACEIVADSDQDPVTLKEMVTRICRNTLATYQQPRLIRFVDRIDLSSAGKTLRAKTS